jgi:hypothetical protein
MGIMLYPKQLKYVEYFNCLGSMIITDSRCTHENKERIAMAKEAFNKKQFFHQQIRLKFMEETNKVHYLGHSFVWG